LLRQADARGSADVIYHICDSYRQFVSQTQILTPRSIWSRTEYLMLTDNILVFD